MQKGSQLFLGKKIGLLGGMVIFVLFLAFPAPEVIGQSGWKIIAVITLMIFWWVSEAVPIPVTAMLPIILMPLLGVMTVKEATAPYSHPLIFLFLGGFFMALALQKWDLHSRIALFILRYVGTHASNIMAGFMIATAFLSMWMSNTATTLLMLPIGLCVLKLLKDDSILDRKSERKFSIALLLSIAFSANVGGTATLIGTPPNVIFAAFMKDNYDYEISFAKWMAIGFPFAITTISVSWYLLRKFFSLDKIGEIKGSEQIIEKQWQELGKMKYQEKALIVIFLITIAFWIFKPLLEIKQLTDTVIVMIAAVVLFALPMSIRSFKSFLTWEDTKNLPWGVVLLFGGGLSLASAVKASGLAMLLGEAISNMSNLEYMVIALITIATILLLTEMLGNAALIALMLPVVAAIALKFGESSLFLTIAATLASSCAFMLPIATPPNAIIFASGHMHIKDMVKVGIIMNSIAVLIIMAFMIWIFPNVL